MITRPRKRNSFSLIEILITISILSCVLAGIGLNIPSLLRHERFESGVERVLDEMAFANELMTIYQTDVSLILKNEGGGLSISYDIASFEVKRTFKSKVEKALFIKGIEGVCFDGTKKGTIILSYLADTYDTPKGEITFTCKGKERRIILNDKTKIKEKAFPII